MLSERTLRAGAAEDQVAAERIIAAATRNDGQSPLSDEARLAAAHGTRHALLFAEDDTPVALGVVGGGEIDLVVAPEHRGRGIGSSALATLLDLAGAGRLVAWSHGENPAADLILMRAGFSPARTLLRLALDPGALAQSDADPGLPEGFSLRTYRPHSEDESNDAADWVRVNALAFADHPEQGSLTIDDFLARTGEPWFAADDLLLAHDAAGELAGSAWVKTTRSSTPSPGTTPLVETELYAIGVRPDVAGIGLGGALNRAALARMAAHHPSRVTLYVEGENEPALAMYRNAGYTESSRSQQWSRDLSSHS